MLVFSLAVVEILANGIQTGALTKRAVVPVAGFQFVFGDRGGRHVIGVSQISGAIGSGGIA